MHRFYLLSLDMLQSAIVLQPKDLCECKEHRIYIICRWQRHVNKGKKVRVRSILGKLVRLKAFSEENHS